MKRTSLNGLYVNQDETYQISLGNKTRHVFNSRKKAENFLNRTNKFLTDCVHQCNFLLSDVHKIYRDNWGYFAHDKPNSKQANLFESDRQIKRYITDSDKSLDMIVTRSHFENGNYFVFHHFTHFLDCMQNAIIKLTQLSKQRSNTQSIYLCNSIDERISYMRLKIMNYGKDTATEIITSGCIEDSIYLTMTA